MSSVGSIKTLTTAPEPESGSPFLTVGRLVNNTLLFLRDRSTAYRLMFDTRKLNARLVLKDLLEFSHWGDTNFIENERLAERLRGRQDVVLRIQQHLHLTPKQLFALYNNAAVQTQVEDIEDEENDDGR